MEKIFLDLTLPAIWFGMFMGLFKNSGVLVPIALGIPFWTGLFFKDPDRKKYPEVGKKAWIVSASFSGLGFLFSILGAFIAIHGAQKGPDNLIIFGGHCSS